MNVAIRLLNLLNCVACYFTDLETILVVNWEFVFFFFNNEYSLRVLRASVPEINQYFSLVFAWAIARSGTQMYLPSVRPVLGLISLSHLRCPIGDMRDLLGRQFDTIPCPFDFPSACAMEWKRSDPVSLP